jgi:hypothetical protein
VLTATGFVSAVLSGSSQRTRCNVAASKCDQPDFCNQYEFEFCAYDEYHLNNIVGENNDLVRYSDGKTTRIVTLGFGTGRQKMVLWTRGRSQTVAACVYM